MVKKTKQKQKTKKKPKKKQALSKLRIEGNFLSLIK